jgi:trehalose-phosphatase
LKRGGRLHLLARWGLVRRRLRRARHLALLFDFDGTLVPIETRPSQARLGRGTRRLLTRIARRPHTTVCLISGRRLADLRRRARVPGADFLGLHGWEGNRSADGLPRRAYRMIRNLKRRLAPHLRTMRGVELENKGFALGVHYRRAAPETRVRARAALRQALAARRPTDGLRVVLGKKVWEVLPCENLGKGAAIRQLARRWPARTLAFYLGDDAGDEPAFRALPRAITVLVGRRRKTAARYWLRGPEEVRAFLARLDSEAR